MTAQIYVLTMVSQCIRKFASARKFRCTLMIQRFVRRMKRLRKIEKELVSARHEIC